MFKVKERRENLNLTKEEIAKKADMLLTTYLAIEKGERLAYPFEAVKIARALNATVEEIFHDDLMPKCDDEFLIIAKRYFAKRRKIRPSDLKLKIIKKKQTKIWLK